MLFRAFFVPDDVSSSSRRAAPGDAMHPARDGGRGGGATVNAWNKPLPRPSMGAPGPDLNVLFSAPPGFPAPPSGVPPTASPTETALQRVYAEIPELRMHAPLGAIFTTNGPIPDPSQSVQALRRAAALELAKARRDFLSGKPLPDAIGPGGSPFTATAVYTALAVDASCGEHGVLGLLGEGSGPGGFGGTGGLGNQQKQSASPPCSVDANLLSVAYARMWRHGTVASAVTNALSGSVSDLQNASTNIGVTVAGPDGLGFVDFGIRRCGEVRSKKSSANAKSTSFFETNMDWPVDSFITRHATVTNHNNFPVLLVLVTQAPEITNTFRVRCDHRSLIRHPADRDLPGNSRNEFEFDETETENENDEDPPGPVVLWPGTSYEVSVDFRPDGRSDAPGHCTQWLLVATVECPIGWRQNTKDKKFTPFPARRHETLGDDFVDVADVKITGVRVVAVTTKGSKARREEIRVMLLNPETLRFTPRRLREAFDTVPRALVAPPICLPGFEGVSNYEPKYADASFTGNQKNTNQSWLRIHDDVLPSALSPAAYWGPNGVLQPRHFYRITQDGDREGVVLHSHTGEFTVREGSVDTGFGTTEKFTRLLRVEEQRQALDIRRYDQHESYFQFAGKVERPVFDSPHETQAHYDAYFLHVPGLLEGYPPVAPLDVLKLRCVSVGAEGGDHFFSGARVAAFAAGAKENGASGPVGSTGTDQTPTVTKHFVNSNSSHNAVYKGPLKGFSGKKSMRRERDESVPLDLNTEVCVTVWRVIPRLGVVVVVFPPCVSRTTANHPRSFVKAHVRFTHDQSAFRLQVSALRNAKAVTKAMLPLDESVPNSPVYAAQIRARGIAAQNVQIVDYKLDDLLARDFLETNVFDKLKRRLNQEQLAVVTDVLSGAAAVCDKRNKMGHAPLGAPYCCFGPPGTGKTVTNVAAAFCVLLNDKLSRVLLCAPAPFAADVVCSRLNHLFTEMFTAMVPEMNGLGADLFSPLLPWTSACAKQPGQRVWTMARVNDPRRDPVSVKQDVLNFCAEPASDAALHARVVVATCMSAGLLTSRFTHVFVDEAGQATLPETLVPLRLVDAHTKAVVLFGDPKQLGPVVHSGNARELRESLLASAVAAHEAEAKTVSEDEKKKKTRRLTKLTRNYRSHGDIFGLSSRLFYDNSLISAANEQDVELPKSLVHVDTDHGVESNGVATHNTQPTTAEELERRQNEKVYSLDSTSATRKQLSAVSTSRPARVLFVGCRGVQQRDGFGEAPSFFNFLEAQSVVDLICAWLDTDSDSSKTEGDKDDASLFLRAKDVGVIAPYRAQVVRLRTLLRARGLGDIRVGTVDDYQGQEERVMFISTVTSRGPPPVATGSDSVNPNFENLIDETRTGFLSCPKRFNVAVTRAKALNVIVGHPVALEQYTHWKALLQHCLQRGAYVGEGAEALAGRSLPDAGTGSRGVGDASGACDAGDVDEDDDGYKALASAISRIAEQSLLGGGDADEMFPDAGGSEFGEHQSWRVAL